MSGNTTQTGLHAGQGGLAVAGYNFLPIPLFVAGVFSGALIWHSALAQALALDFRAGRRPARAGARRRRPGSAPRLVRHHRAEPRHGHHEHLGDPRRRSVGEPWLCERNLEQPCPAPWRLRSRACLYPMPRARTIRICGAPACSRGSGLPSSSAPCSQAPRRPILPLGACCCPSSSCRSLPCAGGRSEHDGERRRLLG